MRMSAELVVFRRNGFTLQDFMNAYVTEGTIISW